MRFVLYVLQVTWFSRDWKNSYPVVLAVKDRAKSSVSSWYQSARLITARLVQLKIDLQVREDWQISFCSDHLGRRRRVGALSISTSWQVELFLSISLRCWSKHCYKLDRDWFDWSWSLRVDCVQRRSGSFRSHPFQTCVQIRSRKKRKDLTDRQPCTRWTLYSFVCEVPAGKEPNQKKMDRIW